jgi:hypothetical protein
MVSATRKSFNDSFSIATYQSFIEYFFDKYGIKIPFRVAETPLFLSEAFKQELVLAGESVLRQIMRPEILEYSVKAIPPQFYVPGEMGNPTFLAIDFAISADSSGNPFPQLIEFQGFPSLYAFQSQLKKVYAQFFTFPDTYTQFFNGLDETQYIAFLKRTILGSFTPQEVILLEIDPWKQATSIDFAITKSLIGIETVDIQDLILENNALYYLHHGKKQRVKRIYNRLIFDELITRKDLKLSFHMTESVQVEWVNHPNWYFRFSKFLMPRLSGAHIPSSYFLNELTKWPKDLENYVLKPLFSFSGSGVVYNVEAEYLEDLPNKENYLLQQKVSYLPIVESIDSMAAKVKAEVRLLYIWDPEVGRHKLFTNLCRLSQGEMIGVKFNKDKTWVGGSIALFI